MKETLYLEIPVEISFSIDPGQKATHWEPGFPPCVWEMDINPGQILDEIRKVIFDDKSDIPEKLMEIVRQRKGAAEEDAADRKYHEGDSIH